MKWEPKLPPELAASFMMQSFVVALYCHSAVKTTLRMLVKWYY